MYLETKGYTQKYWELGEGENEGEWRVGREGKER